MDELSSAPPKRVTLAPRLGYEDSPREDAALVLEDAAQSRVTLAPRGEPLKEATEPSTPLTPPLTPPAHENRRNALFGPRKIARRMAGSSSALRAA